MNMSKGKRNPQRTRKRKRSTSAVSEPKQENEPGDSSNLELLEKSTDCKMLHGSRQTDPTYSQVATKIRKTGILLASNSSSVQPALSITESEISSPSDASSHSSSETETGISPPSDATRIQSASLSIKDTRISPQNDASQLVMVKENENSMDQNNSKYCNSSSFSLRQSVMEITNSNCRPKTPDNPIPPEEMFSPNTVNEFRSTVRVLFPNGPPPLPPIIPVKKRKKGDTPYIVGCTKRRRVPESKTLKFFKGDDYGITSKTNALVEDEKCTTKKRGRKTCNRNWSKSLFNPKSEEIAARLKLNERVDELLRKSPSKEADSFMPNSYSSKPQAFSPLPSTSKDRETILKNEKSFNESLNYNSEKYEVCDDEELPDIYWDIKGKGKEKTTKPKSHSLRNEYLETISNSIAIDEDMNNNNDADFKETDFCEILSKKREPETGNSVASLSRGMSPKQCTTIDETIINLDNVIEDLKPKANNSNETNDEHHKVFTTIEIKDDDHSEIIQEDLYSVPTIEDVVDIDEVLAELEAFKKKKGRKMRKSVVTVIDPITLLESTEKKMNPVDFLTPNTSLNQTKTECALNKNSFTSSTVIEVPDNTEPVVDVSNYVKDNTATLDNDIAFIDETPPDKIMNTRTRINELRLRNNRTNIGNTEAGSNSDIEVVRIDFADSHADIVRNRRDISDAQMFFMLLTEQQILYSNYSKENDQKRKRGFSHVNNENVAPAISGQTPATNGELGDCPICMDSLSKNSLASTICGHMFCVECIKKCLNTSGKRCPTCRKQLKGTGYHQVFL